MMWFNASANKRCDVFSSNKFTSNAKLKEILPNLARFTKKQPSVQTTESRSQAAQDSRPNYVDSGALLKTGETKSSHQRFSPTKTSVRTLGLFTRALWYFFERIQEPAVVDTGLLGNSVLVIAIGLLFNSQGLNDPTTQEAVLVTVTRVPVHLLLETFIHTWANNSLLSLVLCENVKDWSFTAV